MRTVIVILSFFLVDLSVGSVVAQDASPKASEIIDKMTATYSAASSYESYGDVGIIKDLDSLKGMTFLDALSLPSLDLSTSATYKFFYSRPDRLRFEWNDSRSSSSRTSVVWSDGKSAFSWTSGGTDEGNFIWDKESSLKWAIEEETRGSSDVALLLHNGLNGSKEFFSFNRLENMAVVREDSVDGHVCYVVQGNISGDPWVLWVDKQNYYIRRYRFLIATGSFDESVRTGHMPVTIGETNHRGIVIGRRIPRSVFQFTPTLRKGDLDISNVKRDKVTAPKPF